MKSCSDTINMNTATAVAVVIGERQICRTQKHKRKTKLRMMQHVWTTATVSFVTICSITSHTYSYRADAFSPSAPLAPLPLTQHHTHCNYHQRQGSALNVSRSPPPSSVSLNSDNSDSRIPKIAHFNDLEELLAPKPTYTINVEAEGASSSIIKRKIVNLLKDDDGEEDDETPDYSEAAANEIAEKSSYSRISEEAKMKANYAMQKMQKTNTKSMQRAGATVGVGGRNTKIVPSTANLNGDGFLLEDDDEHVVVKKKRRFTASVKETGVDTMSQYVKSMGSHELLPKDSEILLGRQIQILVGWENIRQELEEKLSRPPTFAQWSAAVGVTVPELKKQIRRSQRAKAAMIEANLRLVVTVGRQTVKKGRSEINFQDACQEGILGLNKACEKFDPEKGFRFSTYAIWWIKREVRKNLLEQSRSVRLPASAIKKINDIRISERLLMTTLGRKPTDEEVSQKCNLTVEKILFYRRKALDATSLDKQMVGKAGKGSSASGIESNGKTIGSLVKDLGPTPSEIANEEMLQNDVRRLIRTLSPREQAVVRLRFGLDDGTPRTLDYISNKFNVGKEKIRKVEARALLKLRQPYRNQSVKCYVSDL